MKTPDALHEALEALEGVRTAMLEDAVSPDITIEGLALLSDCHHEMVAAAIQHIEGIRDSFDEVEG